MKGVRLVAHSHSALVDSSTFGSTREDKVCDVRRMLGTYSTRGIRAQCGGDRTFGSTREDKVCHRRESAKACQAKKPLQASDPLGK